MHYDAIVIGGSFSGLAAALYLARATRTVCIVDTGLPRNRFAEHSNGFLTQDGAAPAEILQSARAQVETYTTTTFINQAARTATKTDTGFLVELANGEQLTASCIVLAFGISDVLPDLEGLRERWGRSVIHCPYCHGYEVREQKLGVLWTSPLSVHQAMLIPQWGPVTYFLNGSDMPDAETIDALASRDVRIEPTLVRRLIGDLPGLTGVELVDGRVVEIDALFTGVPTRLNSDIGQQLGCALEDGMLGPMISVDDWRQTTVPGVFAAGDIVRPAHSVSWAVADGVTAGTAAHRSIIFPDPH